MAILQCSANANCCLHKCDTVAWYEGTNLEKSAASSFRVEESNLQIHYHANLKPHKLHQHLYNILGAKCIAHISQVIN
jgi:hypothetical protein